jgi:hypothetical protein
MFFYTGFFRCRKKLQAKEKQLPAEKPNTSYNFYVRGFSGLEGRQKLSVHYDRRPPQRQAARQGGADHREKAYYVLRGTVRKLVLKLKPGVPSSERERKTCDLCYK